MNKKGSIWLLGSRRLYDDIYWYIHVICIYIYICLYTCIFVKLHQASWQGTPCHSCRNLPDRFQEAEALQRGATMPATTDEPTMPTVAQQSVGRGVLHLRALPHPRKSYLSLRPTSGRKQWFILSSQWHPMDWTSVKKDETGGAAIVLCSSWFRPFLLSLQSLDHPRGLKSRHLLAMCSCGRVTRSWFWDMAWDRMLQSMMRWSLWLAALGARLCSEFTILDRTCHRGIRDRQGQRGRHAVSSRPTTRFI